MQRDGGPGQGRGATVPMETGEALGQAGLSCAPWAPPGGCALRLGPRGTALWLALVRKGQGLQEGEGAESARKG